MSWADGSDSARSDDELIFRTQQKQPLIARRRVIVGGAGIIALVGCVGLAAPHLAAQRQPAVDGGNSLGQMSARALLESSELTDVVTENLMNMEGRPLSQRNALREEVAGEVKGFSTDLRDRFPDVHAKLEASHLAPHESKAALHSMRTLSDPRSLAVGRALLEAVGETMAVKGDREDLKKALRKSLHPYVQTIRELHEEILPPDLRAPGREQAVWLGSKEDVDPERLSIVQAFDRFVAQGRSSHAQDTNAGSVRNQLSAFMVLMNEKFGNRFETPGLLARRLDYSVEVDGVTQTYTSLVACLGGAMSGFHASAAMSCMMQAPMSALQCVMDMFGSNP